MRQLVKKIGKKEVERVLAENNLQKYDICKICCCSPRTVDRWLSSGMPENQFKLLSYGAKN